MLKLSFCAAIVLIHTGLTVIGRPQEMRRTPSILPKPAEFPLGTLLVVEDRVHRRTYFATSNRLQQLRNNSQFTLKGQHAPPESIVLSADGKLLLLRTSDDSYVLQADTLQLVRHISNSYAWWECSRLGYIDRSQGQIFSHGRKIRASRERTDLITADSTGRYFMGTRLINKGSARNGNTPTYQIQLWEKTKQGSLKTVKLLTTATYDPGSEGNPRRLETLGKDVIIFGVPNGGADNEDYVGVVQRKHVDAPLRESKGRPLQFNQSPIVTKNAIVGIAEVINAPHLSTGERYIYWVTKDKMGLKPITKQISFVTYNANQDKIGLGLSGQNGITVKYIRLTDFGITR